MRRIVNGTTGARRLAILARRGRSDLCAVLRITYVLGAGEVRMAAIDVSPPSRRASIALALAPLPILATFVAIKFGLPNLYHHIIQEDQVLENLQFLLYVAASATGFLAARELRLAGMRGPGDRLVSILGGRPTRCPRRGELVRTGRRCPFGLAPIEERSKRNKHP